MDRASLAVTTVTAVLAATAGAAADSPARAELGVLPLLSVTGDPNVQLALGAQGARVGLFLKVQLPQRLNVIAARSLFERGDELRVRWRGETGAVVRVRPLRGRGLEVQGGIGHEGFELLPRDREAAPIVVENWFVAAGAAYVVPLGARVYLRPGVSVVWLLSDDDYVVDGITTRLRTGFVSPELFIGIAF